MFFKLSAPRLVSIKASISSPDLVFTLQVLFPPFPEMQMLFLEI